MGGVLGHRAGVGRVAAGGELRDCRPGSTQEGPPRLGPQSGWGRVRSLCCSLPRDFFFDG